MSRVIIRRNSMYEHQFCLFTGALIPCLHASSPSSRVVVHLRCTGPLRLPVQVLAAPAPAAASQSGHTLPVISFCFASNSQVVKADSPAQLFEPEPGVMLGAFCFM
jgi:hypothetical protein